VAELDAFIAALPKAELHVHHIGSASPRTVADLAARHEGTTAVPADPDRLAEYFTFTDFAHFITVYQTVADLIRDATDAATLTYDIARDLAAQQVRYAELTLTPYTSIVRGIPAEEFCDAVEDARRRARSELGVTLAWCFDIPGEDGLPAADLTLEVATRLRPDGLVSFGLGGACRANSSRRTSSRPRRSGCTASRMPASRPVQSRSGRR
jgi:adenosine deaminase